MHNAFALLFGCLHARPEYAAGDDEVSRRVQDGDRSGAEPQVGSRPRRVGDALVARIARRVSCDETCDRK